MDIEEAKREWPELFEKFQEYCKEIAMSVDGVGAWEMFLAGAEAQRQVTHEDWDGE